MPGDADVDEMLVPILWRDSTIGEKRVTLLPKSNSTHPSRASWNYLTATQRDHEIGAEQEKPLMAQQLEPVCLVNIIRRKYPVAVFIQFCEFFDST